MSYSRKNNYDMLGGLKIFSDALRGYEAYEPFDRNEMRFFIGVIEAESLSRIYRDTYRS